MKRTKIKQIGKIGKINIEANKHLKWVFNDYGITRCELCGSDYFLTFAHKESRVWYRTCPNLLHSIDHVLLLCQKCHEKMDNRSKTTVEEKNKIFERLRSSSHWIEYNSKA